MSVASPKEAVYYYECSNGRFRLTYFMPVDQLRELDEEGHIRPQVLEDYPDGVDLGCTEHNFEEFHELYDYQPPILPAALRRAFYAIFSTTRDWETFRGTGLIPAAEIEGRVEVIETALREEEIAPEEVETLSEAPSLEARRERAKRQAMQQSRMQAVLELMRVEGIDPEQTLGQQVFSPVEMKEGRTSKEVFENLHKGRRRR